MRHIISVAIVLLCLWVSMIALDAQAVHKSWLLRARESVPEEQVRQLSRRHIVMFAVVIAACSAITMWTINGAVSDGINWLKLSVALVCMVGSGCVDFVEYRIPNIFPLVLSVSAVVLLTTGYITQQQGAFSYVISSVFSCAVCTIGLVIAALLTRSGIGAGDIKLIASLALIGGVHIVAGTIFWGMLLCACAAGVLLITKKKTMKQSIPFGPFLLIGYMVTIWTLDF